MLFQEANLFTVLVTSEEENPPPTLCVGVTMGVERSEQQKRREYKLTARGVGVTPHFTPPHLGEGGKDSKLFRTPLREGKLINNKAWPLTGKGGGHHLG